MKNLINPQIVASANGKHFNGGIQYILVDNDGLVFYIFTPCIRDCRRMRACTRHLLIFYANLCKRDEIILISIAATKLSPEILQLNEIRINLNAFCDLEHQQRVHQWGWNGVDPGYHDDG